MVSKSLRIWLFLLSTIAEASLRAKRSNPESSLESNLDCFVAEPVIGPRFARTRWLLAMTKRHDSAFPRHDLPELAIEIAR
jgi:hypothetical protein